MNSWKLGIFILLLTQVSVNAQNIGINNPDPQAALDINGDLRLRTQTLTLPQGISHDVDLTTQKAAGYNFTGGALDGAIISGFNGGVDGRIVTIFNNGNSAIQLYHEAGGSLAGNRILTGTGNNAIIYQNGSVTMRYDGQKMRWTIISSNYTDGLSATPPPPPITAGNYGTVVNPVTGKVWLDRNLGALQVATSSTDPFSFGDLYQWGRNADGHQKQTSSWTTSLADRYFTDNSLFIKVITSPYNWLTSGETHMWSGVAAENNPCPSGFRVPTAAEWEQERQTWTTNDAAGAFASLLKLPVAGFRGSDGGLPYDEGTLGCYWSSTVYVSNWSHYLRFQSDGAIVDNAPSRASGMSVRCIQD